MFKIPEVSESFVDAKIYKICLTASALQILTQSLLSFLVLCSWGCALNLPTFWGLGFDFYIPLFSCFPASILWGSYWTCSLLLTKTLD